MTTTDPGPMPDPERNPLRQLHSWVDADLHEWLRTYAYTHDLTKSRAVRRLLDDARRREPLTP